MFERGACLPGAQGLRQKSVLLLSHGNTCVWGLLISHPRLLSPLLCLLLFLLLSLLLVLLPFLLPQVQAANAYARRCGFSPEAVHFVVGDALAPLLPAASFDVVLSLESACYMPDKE